MFWQIFIQSLVLIVVIILTGQGLAALINRKHGD
jgi:hypothetical protein